ncbi:hypothetical protein TWF788_010119 [Orbilia oligospora]|uniref:Rhodopsin domain-containing protein n=1 Tax=Orbilia oligospora TaxID=2813651 RepID=A0A7C8PQD5_ORBOL|nr:hypothetical protein TWF788_010119 [Orbilia oligospora]
MSRFLDTLAFEWAMVIGTIFLVILRLYHRNRYAYITLFEDGFVVVAWLCFLNQVSLDTALYDLGFFKEESGFVAVGVDGGIVGTTSSKIFFVKNTTYYFCMYAAKTAMLCFYTRFIPETMKKTRVCLWVTVTTVVLGFVTSMLLDLLLCMPISRNRQSHDTDCQANSPNSPGYTMSISSIVDFYDLERQLQLDDEKRQATNCSPVLERASSELRQGSNPSLLINSMEKDLESSRSSQRVAKSW